MNSPALSPETTQGLLGNLIKSSYSLKLWLGIAWVGFLILPWYAAYDGFWSFIWITDGYPTFDEYSPGILQITMHQRWWLWPKNEKKNKKRKNEKKRKNRKEKKGRKNKTIRLTKSRIELITKTHKNQKKNQCGC